jgi:hypothetical protein
MGILRFSCIYRSCNQFKIFHYNWVKYSNIILVGIIHLLCVCRWFNQLQIVASDWSNYVKGIVLWIVHFSCVRRSCNPLQIVRSNRENIPIESSYELLISLAHVIQCNEFEIVASNCATYVHRILVWIIHFSCANESCDQLEIIALDWPNIWIEALLKLLIYRMFFDRLMNFKSLFEMKQIIWIGHLFELFICCMSPDHVINS